MSDKSIAEKLLIKDGRKALFVNAPSGYRAQIGALPPNATVLKASSVPADVIQVFVKSRAELEAAEANVRRQQKLLKLGIAEKSDVARAEEKLAELKAAKN